MQLIPRPCTWEERRWPGNEANVDYDCKVMICFNVVLVYDSVL